MKTNIHRSAEYYAKHFNWHVFPCAVRGKTPITTNGLLDASLDYEQINKWYTKTPDANLAIRTGRESGIFVIDLDGETGKESFKSFLEDHGEKMPDTVTSITGNDGMHILFKYPKELGKVKSCTDWLGVGSKVDIRGDGGYIIAAPSIHPNGTAYEWEISSRPGEVEIAEAPQFIIEKLRNDSDDSKQTIIKRDSSYWDNIIQGISEGGRNDAATRLAGHLYRKYVDETLIIEIMFMWNERNNPPMDAKELTKTIMSVRNKEMQRRQNRKV